MDIKSERDAATEIAGSDTNQYLTFTMEGETYAVDVHHVKEVLEYTEIAKVPRTKEYMRGVINLRGSVVPVVDLRTKFGMGQTEKTTSTSIVVMDLELQGETVVLGALVDSVEEVIGIEDEQIEPPPSIGTTVDSAFIRGIGKQEDRFIIVLDIERVFQTEELQAVTDAS